MVVKTNIVKQLRDIPAGTVFRFIGEDDIYIKTDDIDSTEAIVVNLKTGQSANGFNDSVIMPLCAEMNIYEWGDEEK